MKIDELTNRNKEYNPIWKLQVTDDKSKVLYEGNFVDRNQEDREFTFDNNKPPIHDYRDK
jgi:hypothetical protein